MATSFRAPILKGAIVVAIFLAALVALYALFLLIVGERWTVVQEGEATRSVQFVPDPDALVPLLAATLLLSGLVTRKLLIAWIGLVVLSTFGALFLFGVGGILLPVAGLLLILLTIITIIPRNTG